MIMNSELNKLKLKHNPLWHILQVNNNTIYDQKIVQVTAGRTVLHKWNVNMHTFT